MPLQGQSYFMASTHNNITIKAFPFQMKTMIHCVELYGKKRQANGVKSNIAKENVKNGRINIKI